MTVAAAPLENVNRLKVSADFTSVREAIATVTEQLEQRFLNLKAYEADPETSVITRDSKRRKFVADVELVLAEISNNIVEHSYQNYENACFSVELLIAERSVRLRFIDFGLRLPPRLLREQLNNFTVEKNIVPEHGFGWQIIRVLAKDIRYRRKLRANVLEVSMSLCQS